MKVYTVVLIRKYVLPFDIDIEIETHLFENSDSAALYVEEQDKKCYWSKIYFNEVYVK